MSASGIDYPITITLKAINQTNGALEEVADKLGKLGGKGEHAHEGLFNLLGGEAILGIGEKIGEAGEKIFEFGKEAFEVAKQLVESTVEAGAALGALSKRTGLSANALVQWQYAAKQSHVGAEDFASAMDHLNKRVGEAKAGGGSLLKFLNKVSPAFAKQLKGVHSNEEALDLLSKAFEKVQDPQKRAALQAAAFGKGARDMGVFLGQGVEKLKELRAEGGLLTGDQTEFVRNSEEAEEAINRISTAFDALKNQTVAALLPALEPVFTELTKLLVDNREDLKSWAHDVRDGIHAWFEGGGLERVHTGLSEIATDLKYIYRWGKLAFDAVNLMNPVGLMRGAGHFQSGLSDLAGDLEKLQGSARDVDRSGAGSVAPSYETRQVGSQFIKVPRLTGADAVASGDRAAANYGLTVDFKNVPHGTKVRGSGGPAVEYSVDFNLGTQ